MTQQTEPLLQELSAGFTDIPFNRMLGLKLDHLDARHVTMSFAMKNELIGNFMRNILHGGVISSVLDMAGGMVVMASAIEKNKEKPIHQLSEIIGKCSTIDLQVNYIRPGKGERFIAKGDLIRSGNKISFTRMSLYNEKETLIAMGSGTYLISEK